MVALWAAIALLMAMAPEHSGAARAATPAGSFVAGWGTNLSGQLGAANCCQVAVPPQPVQGVSGAVALAGDERVTTAVLANGTVVVWGQTGASSTCSSHCGPTAIPGLSNVTYASAGENLGVALERDGSLWTWKPGANPVPTQVMTDVKQVAQSWGMIVALKTDDTVWEWGTPVGGSDPYAGASPRQVSGLTGISQVSNRDLESLALSSSGEVWQWGYVASGNTAGWSSPQQVAGFSGTSPIVQIAAGAQFGLVRRADGTVWAWGNNNGGQLGGGNSGVGTGIPFGVQVFGVTHATSIAAGASHALALTSDGRVWAWGANDEGQVDLRQPSSSGCSCVNHPVQIAGIASASAIAAGDNTSLALIPHALPLPAPTRLKVCASPQAASRFGTPVGRHPGVLAVADAAGLAFAADAGATSFTTGLPTCASQVSAFRLASGKKAWNRTLPTGVTWLAFDRSTGHVLVAGGTGLSPGSGYLALLDQRSGKIVRQVTLTGFPLGVAFAPTSHSIWVATQPVATTLLVTRFDSRTGAGGAGVSVPAAGPPSGAPLWLDAHRGWLVVAHGTAVDVRAASTGKAIRTIKVPPVCGSTPLGISSASDRLYMTSPGSSHGDRGSLCIVDLLRNRIDATRRYAAAEGPFNLVVDDMVRLLLVTVGQDGPVNPDLTELLDAHSGRYIRSLHLSMGGGVVDGRGRVYAANGGKVVRLYQPGKWNVVRSLSIAGTVGDFALSQRYHRLIVDDTTHGTIRIIPAS
jgi:alpha-tubulin suppressor-like RCC1 family protein